MSLELPSEIRSRIEQKVGDRYASAADVIGEALDLLDRRDAERLRLQREVERGLSALDAGDYREFGSEQLRDFFADAKQRGRQTRSRSGHIE